MIIKQRLNKISLYMTVSSFLIGTILLLAYSYTNKNELVDIGLMYTQIAALINTTMLVILIYKAITDPSIRIETLITITILLANIPIALIYTIIAFFNSFSNWPD